MNYIKFDIIPGRKCNFRCKYCYEKNGFSDAEMSMETIDKSVKLIKDLTLYCNNTYGETGTHLYFFGGEPLYYMDKILYMCNQFDSNLVVNLTTNGSMVNENINELLELNNKFNLRLNISYDYYMQNITRKDGTYESVRNAIKTLSNLGLTVRTITVFDIDTLKYFYDVVEDYHNLITTENLTHNFQYNIDNGIISDTTSVLNEISLIRVLRKTLNYIKNNNIKDKIIYNSHNLRKTYINICNDLDKLKSPFYGICNDIFCGIDCDGTVYTELTAAYSYSSIRDYTIYGTVNDDYKTIMANRNNFIDSTHNPNILQDCERCINCPDSCKTIFWRAAHKGNIKMINNMPSENWCKIHDLLYKFKIGNKAD